MPRIAVNVSVKQFVQRNFLEMVTRTLTESGLDPQVLQIEITESVLLKDPEGVAVVLGALKALNVHIAIDDFGTGYSSLSRLRQLPIDCLKIDRSFMRGIGSLVGDQAIASAVIAMADSMEFCVIGEGVETSAQLAFLRRRHCQEAQGFLLSAPLPPEQAEAFLLENASPSDRLEEPAALGV